MLKRIWAIIQKELIQTLRDRSTLAMMLSMPMLQIFLFGYAVNMTVDHIPMAVADYSLDSASHAYVMAFVGSGYFDVLEYVPDQAAVIAAIDAGRAQAGMVIPADFAARVERGEAQVLFLIDGSDLFTTQSAYSAAAVIAQVHAGDLIIQKVNRAGLPFTGKPPLEARTRILYNPDMDQLRFVVPGLAAMILQTQSIAMTALAVVREYEVGTMEQLLVTPIRPLELMLGKIAPNIIIALLNMSTVIGVGVFMFDVPFRGNLWLFVQLSLLYVFSGLGLGLLISTVSKNLKQAMQLVMLVMIIGVVLGGFMFPRYTMPQVLQMIGNLFPLTYFMPIARGIISKGVGLDLLWSQALAMLVYSVVIMLAAARLFRQSLE